MKNAILALIIAAMSLVAVPAQADINRDEAAVLGLLFGAIIGSNVNRNRNTVHQHYHHQVPQNNIHWNQQCGWYERATIYWDRIVYQRFNGCDHTLIGERWEQR
jgi:hypothetical protein